ncbi:MAG: LPXTG cell wall anchor domain-containing protein [Cryomorphaceae bacterium]|nr:MAG: LPXTG cell wall anchor domain-containing protein [Cryomorphaceae bacterium]|tara:strand:- start:95 stop:292 length:198 start_codon:yes stop_codon:yes gene_type:complete
MKFSWNETIIWLCLLSNLIFFGSELISDYTGIDTWSIIYFGIGLVSIAVLILIYLIILKFKKNKK